MEIICREHSLSPVLSLENITWCSMRVCSSLILQFPYAVLQGGSQILTGWIGREKDGVKFRFTKRWG